MREKCSKRFFDNFHRFGHFVQKLSKIGLWRMPMGLFNAPAIFLFKNFKKKFLKNFEFFFFSKSKKTFGRQKSTFCPYEHHYDSPLPTLRKILKFLKWRFFALFFEKNQKFYYLFISSVEIWLV